MVDIQSPTAEIRRRIKKKEDGRRKKEERNYRMKILWSALLHRATIETTTTVIIRRYLLYPTIFLFTLTTLWINKYLLLIDRTFRNGYSTIDA